MVIFSVCIFLDQYCSGPQSTCVHLQLKGLLKFRAERTGELHKKVLTVAKADLHTSVQVNIIEGLSKSVSGASTVKNLRRKI